MAKPDQLGAKLGPRVARLVTDAHGLATAKATPHKVRAAMHFQEQFFRLVGHEISDTLGPMLRTYADDDNAPDWLRATLAFAADGLGQWQTFLANHVAGSVLDTGIGAVVTNELSPWVQQVLLTNPHGLIPIEGIVDQMRRGYMDAGYGNREAGMQGLPAHRLARMVEAAASQLDVGAITALYNRGVLPAAFARQRLTRIGYDESDHDLVLELARTELPPAMLADAVVRGIIAHDAAAQLAARSGVHADDFDLLVRDTGEAPALQMLLEGYRRGLVNDATLEHGIRTGRLRNEWIPLAKELRYAPPSVGDVLAGAVQGHLPDSEARRLAAEAGLDPKHYQWEYDTHGMPISVGQALELWNRGDFTRSQVEAVIREGRTKDKYVPAVLKLRKHVLPMRTVVAVYHQGGFTQAQMTRHLADLGVVPEDITAMLHEAHSVRQAAHKQLAQSTLLDLYEAHAVDRAQAVAGLKALGYDDHEAAQILALAELRAERKLQTAVVNVVRSRYVGRHISEAAASGALDAAQVSAAEREHLLSLWSLERDTTTRLPTVAELTAAHKADAITATEWADRIVALGYAPADVPIMAAAHKITLGG